MTKRTVSSTQKEHFMNRHQLNISHSRWKLTDCYRLCIMPVKIYLKTHKFHYLAYSPVLPHIVCICTVLLALASWNSFQYIKWTGMYRVALPNCVLNFCVVNITREEFHVLNQNCRILNKILHISGNIVSKKNGRPHFRNVRTRIISWWITQ